PGEPSGVKVDTSQAVVGIVRVTYTIRSATDWDKLPWLENHADVRAMFRDRERRRSRYRKPENVIRVIAVHYLSDEGGSERSLRQAADLYEEHWPSEDGSVWDAFWHAKIKGKIEAEYGPLL
ncbi:MAG: hypothetical protein ABIZ57_08910, partial [Candidatus Limnocylindria bacterium]